MNIYLQFVKENLNNDIIFHFSLCFCPSVFHRVMAASQEQMVFPVCMACRDLLGHLAAMDVTELKETRAVQERLDPRDLLVIKERREQREFLVSRALSGKKESEERKGRVEIQERLSFPRT